MFTNSRQKLQMMWILLLLGMLQVSVIQTQDATPTDITEPEPTAVEVMPTAVPTEIPTDVSTELATEIPSEEPTDMPTEVATEVPTEMPTEVLTEEPTEVLPVETTVEVAPEASEEVSLETPTVVSGTESVVETPTVDVTEVVVPTEEESVTVPDEPPMQLLIRELFNNGDLSPWWVPTGWLLVSSEGGQALQVTNSIDPLILQKGVFFNVAVQARFAINNGDAQLHIQRGNEITFSASLDGNGTVTLSKNDDILQTTVISLDTTQVWHSLRLAIVEGVIRVAVDGDEVMAIVNEDAFQAGGIQISAGDDPSDEVVENQVLMDDFFLWVPEVEADRYPPPTPVGVVTDAPVVVVSTAVPTVLPTESAETKDITEESQEVAVQQAARDVIIPLAIPDAPVLRLPADGTVTSNVQERLNWYLSRGVTYLVDVDDNSDFSSPLYENSVVTRQFIPPTSLAQGTYFWRVQAQNEGGTSAESEVWSFTVNILTSPVDGSAIFMRGTASDTTVSLRWSRVNGATQFMLYLYDDLGCTSLMSGYPMDMGTLTGTRLVLGKGQYCWKVQAVGVDGGIPDIFSTFMVSPPALDAPILLSPSSRSLTNGRTPTLDWEGVVDAVDYKVEWSTDRRFGSDVNSAIVNAPTSEYVLPLLPETAGTTYYWQVAARSDLGVEGKWSRPFDFTLDTVAPDILELKSPADGAVTSNPQESLSWQSSRGDTYRVDLDDDNNFSSPLYEDSFATRQFVPALSLPQGTYFWRVQAEDAAGNVSGESDEWSFTVNILTSPVDGSAIFMRGTASDTMVSLRWSRVNGATQFMLYLYDDLGCTSLMSGYPMDMGTSTGTRLVLGKGQYCWKVQAVGVDGGIPDIFSTFMVSPPALDAPTLLSPGSRSLTNDRTPTLDWEGVVDAVDYKVEWSTDRRFGSDVNSAIVNAPTSEYVLPLLQETEGTTYYWQVAARSDLGVEGRWSRAFEFTLDTVAPDIPELKSPVDGAVTSNPLQPLSLQFPSGAVICWVDVDDSDDFSSPLYDDSPISRSFTPTSSLPQGTYFLRAQCQDAAGNLSGWSEVWSFTVNILTSPVDGSAIFMRGTASDTTVSLRLSRVNGATQFMLYLYDDLDCTSLMSGYPMDMGTSTSARLVLGKGQYCWKVQAVGVDGGIPDIFSTFMVSPPALDAPTLLSPGSRSLTNDRTPTLDWEAVGDAVDYKVEWSTDRRFGSDVNSAIVNAPTTEYVLPILPETPGTTYYWQVAARSDLGVEGKWSRPFDFTLDTVAPDAPELISPIDLSTLDNSLPTFTWQRDREAKQYEIRLDTVDPPVVPDTTTSTRYAPPSPLLLTIYYWQVRSVDAAGNVSDWSNAGDAWEVTITSKSLAPPVLNRFAPENPSPMDLPPTLCWSPISWAEGYELQVDNHDRFSSPIYTNDTIGDDTQCVTIDPLYDGTWYWRARAIQTGSNTNWSPTGTFTVES